MALAGILSRAVFGPPLGTPKAGLTDDVKIYDRAVTPEQQIRLCDDTHSDLPKVLLDTPA